MDGLLVLNKPWGITSFRVVSLVRRLIGEKRVGHGGTLDPRAEGVLVLGIGKGTRALEFLSLGTKVYRGDVHLGIATDTYDGEGRVLEQKDPGDVTPGAIEQALEHFRGSIEQTPPVYSAIKQQGRPLYQLARSGVAVSVKPRRVHVHRLELTGWEPPILTLEVECSPGTYIRSIAHDLGQVLGCGAHLKSLVRLRDGPFILEESVTLEEMEKRADEGGWDDLLRPLDAVMGGWTKVILESLLAEDVLHGRDVELDQVDGEMNESQGLCAAYSADGQLLAVLRRRPDSGVWHPYKVLV